MCSIARCAQLLDMLVCSIARMLIIHLLLSKYNLTSSLRRSVILVTNNHGSNESAPEELYIFKKSFFIISNLFEVLTFVPILIATCHIQIDTYHYQIAIGKVQINNGIGASIRNLNFPEFHHSVTISGFYSATLDLPYITEPRSLSRNRILNKT